MWKNYILILLALLVPDLVFGQDQDLSLFEIAWANDVYFNRDSNFSNGIEIKYTSPSLSKAPIAWITKKSTELENSYYSLSLTQDIYTPENLSSVHPIRHDRPFASYTLIKNERRSFNQSNRTIKKTGISIGVLGKYSGGKTVQNFVHKILPDTDRPIGWDNQIRPDVAFNYSLELEKGVTEAKRVSSSLLVNIDIGTPFTQFEIGNNLMIGNVSGYFNGLTSESGKLQAYFFLKTKARLRLYDATLQGGFFNGGSLHTIGNIKSKSGSIEFGFTLQNDVSKLQIGQVYRSHDFAQGSDYNWIYIRYEIRI